jgi:hypothetical protein
VNLDNDPQHCGDCGMACPAACGGGQCVDNCDGFPDSCGNSCTNTEFDPLNCGECGHTCDANELCVSGECRNYEPAPCDQCPCDCNEGMCCDFPFLDIAVCVHSDRCGTGG